MRSGWTSTSRQWAAAAHSRVPASSKWVGVALLELGAGARDEVVEGPGAAVLEVVLVAAHEQPHRRSVVEREQRLAPAPT